MPQQKRSYASYRRGGRRRPYRSYNYKRIASRLARPGAYRIRGQGDYKTFFRGLRKRFTAPYTGRLAGLGHTLGGTVGNMIAPGIGSTIGGAIGAGAGFLTDRIMGWGDYEIKRNVLLMPNQAGSVPTFGKSSIRVTHKEYVGTIVTSEGGAFSIQGFPLNPGLVNSFPWLSQIAANYEQYVWNGMIWQFISTSADALNSTNTALGKVTMATDYNASDGNFVSMQQMMGTEFSNSGKPAMSLMHAIECAPSQQATKIYWVRTGPLPVGIDEKLYDHGKFEIATEGTQAASVIGDLWVSYDVTFLKPVNNNVLGYQLPVSHYKLQGVTSAKPFGNGVQTPTGGSNIDGLSVGDAIVYFPLNDSIGTYMLIYTCHGTNAALVAPTIATASCTAKDLLWDATVATVENSGVTDDKYLQVLCVQVDGRDAQLSWSGATLPSAIDHADLFVVKIPYDLE